MQGNLQLSQRGCGLRSSCRDLDLAQSVKKLFSINARLHDVEHGSNTHARHKDHKIELSPQQPFRKLQCLRVRLETDLTHGGHNNRFAAVSANEFFNLFRAAGLE